MAAQASAPVHPPPRLSRRPPTISSARRPPKSRCCMGDETAGRLPRLRVDEDAGAAQHAEHGRPAAAGAARVGLARTEGTIWRRAAPTTTTTTLIFVTVPPPRAGASSAASRHPTPQPHPPPLRRILRRRRILRHSAGRFLPAGKAAAPRCARRSSLCHDAIHRRRLSRHAIHHGPRRAAAAISPRLPPSPSPAARLVLSEEQVGQAAREAGVASADVAGGHARFLAKRATANAAAPSSGGLHHHRRRRGAPCPPRARRRAGLSASVRRAAGGTRHGVRLARPPGGDHGVMAETR